MNRRNSLVVLAILWSVVSSCEREGESPRTYPRVGMALVQGIDESGAVFSGEIYDFGSEEILEYGFLYSPNPEMNITNANMVKESGKPEKVFQMKATHSLRNGETYYTAAFLRTAEHVVYSKAVPFVSMGSEGFVLEKIEHKDLLYFGDTVAVTGKNISSSIEDLRVLVNQSPAMVFDRQPDGFKFVLPEDMYFYRSEDDKALFYFRFEVFESVVEVERMADFREPEFDLTGENQIIPGRLVYVQGNYLGGKNPRVFYKNPEYGEIEIHNPVATNTYVSFPSRQRFMEKYPTIIMELRGKRYELKKPFELVSTELVPGQTFEVKLFEPFNIKGENFVSWEYRFNDFISTNPDLSIEVQGATETSIDILISDWNFPSRSFEIFAYNYGVKSANSAKVTLMDAGLPFVRYPNFLNHNVYASGQLKEYNSEGYFFGQGTVYKFNPSSKQFALVSRVSDASWGALGVHIFETDNKGKLFVGYSPLDNDGNVFTKLYSLTTSDGKLTAYPTPPLNAVYPMATVVDGNYLYFFGVVSGVNWNPVNNLRLNLTTQEWEIMDGVTNSNEYAEKWTTFRYRNDTYAISIRNEEGFKRLSRFNPATEDWEGLAVLDEFGTMFTSNLAVIGSNAYFTSSSGFIKLDLNSYKWTVMDVSPSCCPTYSNVFESKGKIYMFATDKVMEIDTDYF